MLAPELGRYLAASVGTAAMTQNSLIYIYTYLNLNAMLRYSCLKFDCTYNCLA